MKRIMNSTPHLATRLGPILSTRAPRSSDQPLPLKPITLRDIPRWLLAFAFVYLSASDFHPLWLAEAPVAQPEASPSIDPAVEQHLAFKRIKAPPTRFDVGGLTSPHGARTNCHGQAPPDLSHC